MAVKTAGLPTPAVNAAGALFSKVLPQALKVEQKAAPSVASALKAFKPEIPVRSYPPVSAQTAGAEAGLKASLLANGANLTAGRLGGNPAGMLQAEPTIHGNVLKNLWRGIGTGYLDGVRPLEYAASKVNSPALKTVLDGPATRMVAGSLGRMSLTGTALAGGAAGANAVNAYDKRYQLATDTMTDALASRTDMTDSQRQLVRKELGDTLRNGKLLDVPSMIGRFGAGTDNVTPEQADLARSLAWKAARNSVVGAGGHNRGDDRHIAQKAVDGIYDATRFTSPAAFAASRYGIPAVEGLAKKWFGKPYTPAEAASDVDAYRAANKNDPAQAASGAGKAVSKGIADTSAAIAQRQLDDSLGEQRSKAYGVGLSGRLDRDLATSLTGVPEDVAREIFTKGDIPISRTIDSFKNLHDAVGTARRAANRTVAETAYDTVHPGPVTKWQLPPWGKMESPQELPDRVNALAKRVKRLPDDIDIPDLATQAYKPLFER